jgi:hypothetical protein
MSKDKSIFDETPRAAVPPALTAKAAPTTVPAMPPAAPADDPARCLYVHLKGGWQLALRANTFRYGPELPANDARKFEVPLSIAGYDHVSGARVALFVSDIASVRCYDKAATPETLNIYRALLAAVFAVRTSEPVIE